MITINLEDVVKIGIPIVDIQGKDIVTVVAEALSVSKRQAREWLKVGTIKRRYTDKQFIIISKGSDTVYLIKGRNATQTNQV